MKKLLVFFLALVTLMPLTAIAQKENKESRIKRELNWAKDYFDSFVSKKLDTAYITRPKNGWLASVTTNFASIDADITGKNIPIYGNVAINAKSALSNYLGFAFGYRGLSLKYSLDIFNGYSHDLTLARRGHSWGVEFKRHSTDGMHGTLSSSKIGNSFQINKGDVNVATTIVDGYVVFNPKKFSLPAVLTKTFVQRRSAGSLIAFATYQHSKMTTDNAQLMQRLGGIKKLDFNQVAVGLGYGYNFAADNGNLLIHASAIPMAVIHNNNFATIDFSTTLTDGTLYKTDIIKKLEIKHKVSFTGLARISAHYTFKDRYLVGVSGLINDIRFKSTSGLSVQLDDWLVSATFGVRFK